MEENIINNAIEGLEDVQITELVPESEGCTGKILLAGGIGFLGGVIVTKIAKPVTGWIKHTFFEKKITKEDFEVLDDDDVEDVESEETEK